MVKVFKSCVSRHIPCGRAAKISVRGRHPGRSHERRTSAETNDPKMATGPKIVHKQFNSPIGLYSQQNIQETLNKHLSNLDNGTVGIDFHNPTTDKPANLANSAVLRMLEEEERNRSRGYSKLDPTQVQAILGTMVRANRRFDKCWPPQQSTSFQHWDGSKIIKVSKGQKKVVWPPVPETNGYHSPQQQSPAFYNSAQHSPAPQSQAQYSPQPQYQSQPPQFSPQPQNQQPQYYQQPQAKPALSAGRRQEATGLSKLIPVGPGVTASPAPSSPYRAGPPSPGIAQPYRPQPNRWAPVPAPVSPQAQIGQPSYQQQFSPQPYAEPYQPPRQFEPPPATITLRQKQPVHQKPPPVFSSQPAAASFKGGVNMRGDQKWPPQSVKEAVEAENEARRMLARGPACRPRKVKKDYSSFFAAHALSHNYPGYRAPPGTQHYEDLPGRSSY